MCEFAATLRLEQVRVFGLACNQATSHLPINCDREVRVVAWKPVRVKSTPSFVPSFLCTMGPICGITLQQGLNSNFTQWEHVEDPDIIAFASAMADFDLAVCTGTDETPFVHTDLAWSNLPQSKEKKPNVNMPRVTKIMAHLGKESHRGQQSRNARMARREQRIKRKRPHERRHEVPVVKRQYTRSGSDRGRGLRRYR